MYVKLLLPFLFFFSPFSSAGWSWSSSDNSSELLPSEQAFTYDHIVESDIIQLNFQIAEGYYLYKKRFSFDASSNELLLASPAYPQGEVIDDPYFGESEIYRGLATITLPYNSNAESAELTLSYQGCADIGVCYPPEQHTILLDNLGTQSTSPAPTPKKQTAGSNQTEQDRFATILLEESLAASMVAFFGVGLLLAFTPCVFPMIPILTSMIAGEGKANSPLHAFGLSVAYVLAMAVTYTIAGVLVGLGGNNIQAAMQSPWVLGVFAALFVGLSLSMFGLYHLQMPTSVQTWLSGISQRHHGKGSYVGALIMGALSALIVGPCVTAPLIGALLVISQTGDPLLGGLALFSLSLGMGLPLILIGTGAGQLLPKAGPWMDKIKSLFGIMLLGTAIWLLDRVIPYTATVLLTGALLLGTAVFMNLLMPASSKEAKLERIIAILLALYGGSLVLGALAGNPSFSQPLQGLLGAPAQPANPTLSFRPIKSTHDLEQALEQASTLQQPVLLDFYADWCVSCKEMEHLTFNTPEVGQALQGWTLLQADVTANDAQDQALLKTLGLFGPPAIIFYDETGVEFPSSRVVGYMPAPEFQQHIQQLIP